MKFHLLPMLLAAAAALGGCSVYDEPMAECPHGGDARAAAADSITLSFQMISSNVGSFSRADSEGHEEIDSEWRAFEDLINLNDFAIYIFLEKETDASGNAYGTTGYDPSGNPLIMRMTDIAGSTDPNTMVTGGYGAYTITMAIDRTQFNNVLGREIDAHSTGDVHFRIVLLANAWGASAKFSDTGAYVSYADLAPTVPTALTGAATTYGEFMARAEKIVYDLNELHNPSEGDSEISGIYKGAIPMFGMNVFKTTEELLYASRPEERINLGTVNMLRSLAKVRVVDKATRDKNADGTLSDYPRVAYAYVASGTERAMLLPYNGSNYTDGQQVHDINVAKSITTDPTELNFKLGYRSNNLERFGYLPEQAIDDPKDNATPVIVVVADLDATRQETYRIPMDGSNPDYPDIDFDEKHVAGFKMLLRNHIYTLQVDKIATGVPATITFSVAPWEESSFKLDYTETLTITQQMNWASGSYSSLADDGKVTLLTYSDDTADPTPLVGTFNIEGPVGATWTAYLIDKEGTAGSFAFADADGKALVDADGNKLASVSGTVDSNSTTLRIVPTATSSTTETRTAELQVVVRLLDGTYIEADITPENTPGYTRFTIVQAATL